MGRATPLAASLPYTTPHEGRKGVDGGRNEWCGTGRHAPGPSPTLCHTPLVPSPLVPPKKSEIPVMAGTGREWVR